MKKPFGFWTKERVFEEARKYQTKNEFRKGCIRAHDVAWKNGWFSEMDWFEDGRKPKGYWTKENVFEEARKYQTKTEFKRNNSLVYKISCKNKWLDEMDWFEDGRVKMFTDKNDCVYRYFFKETNSIYIGRSIQPKMRHWQHLYRENDTLYKYTKENGLEVPQMEIIEDNLTIEEGQKREDYWIEYYKEMGYKVLNVAKAGSIGAIACGKWSRNKSAVFEESKKYKTRSDFRNSCGGAYQIAKRNNWLDEMTWLVSPIKTSGYWKNKKNVIVESKKYKTRGEFQKGCIGAYKVARVNGWLDEMDWFVKPIAYNKKWTKEYVFAEARKYQTRSEFYKGCGSAYVVARRNGWLSEMTWFVCGRIIKWTKENVVAEANKYQTRKEFYKGCQSAYSVARKNKWLDELFPKKCAA